MVDEQHALEVIHFVLQADRKQPVELFLMRPACLVAPADADTVGPKHLRILVGH